MISTAALRAFAASLSAIESLAMLGSVSSTNDLARRVVSECVENDLPLPRAAIVARDQRSGRGRGGNVWSSPPGGIYATLLLSRPKDEIAVVPFEAALAVEKFLRHSFGIDAKIKWPNDLLVTGRKISGILIEAKYNDSAAYLSIGIGINVAAVTAGEAISVEEIIGRAVDLEGATAAFIRTADETLYTASPRDEVLGRWRERTIHVAGERIAANIGERRVEGTWEGIDENGRAAIRVGNELSYVAGGEIIRVE